MDAETNVRAHWAWLGVVVLIACLWATQSEITALRSAVHKNSLEMVKLLLGARAAVDIKSKMEYGCS